MEIVVRNREGGVLHLTRMDIRYVVGNNGNPDAGTTFCGYCLVERPTSEFQWVPGKSRWAKWCKRCFQAMGTTVLRGMPILEYALSENQKALYILWEALVEKAGVDGILRIPEDVHDRCAEIMIVSERIRVISGALEEKRAEEQVEWPSTSAPSG